MDQELLELNSIDPAVRRGRDFVEGTRVMGTVVSGAVAADRDVRETLGARAGR